MTLLDRRVSVARVIALLAICGALLAFATSAALRTEPSGASCFGSGCMPVGSYTLDTSFNCGQITWAACYANGTTNAGSGVWHHFGWGSSSYSGSGDITVGLGVSGGGASFGGWAVDLVRACYYNSCLPQTASNMQLYVSQLSGVPHTVWGHGKA